MTSLAQKKFRIFFCHWKSFIFQNKDSYTSSCLVMVFYAKKTLKIALWRHKNDQWRHKICPSDVIFKQNIFWTFCEHVHTKTKTLQEVVSELCLIELKHIHKISRKSLTSQLWPPLLTLIWVRIFWNHFYMIPNRKVGIYRKFQVDMLITSNVIRKNLRGGPQRPPLRFFLITFKVIDISTWNFL